MSTQATSNGNQTKTTAAPDASLLDSAIEETIKQQSVQWTVADTGEQLDLSISHVRRLFAKPTKKGLLPGNKECWLFLHLCKARGLNPYVGDAFLVGYDAEDGPTFSLITAHQALLKRAEASGKKKGMQSGVIVADAEGTETELPGDYYNQKRYRLVGGWAKVYRADWDFPAYERLSLESRQKPYGQWKKDGAGMIVKCAEASAHRMAFPLETSGMYIREEADTINRNADDLQPTTGDNNAPTTAPSNRTEALAASLKNQVGAPVTTAANMQRQQEQPTQTDSKPSPVEVLRDCRGLMDACKSLDEAIKLQEDFLTNKRVTDLPQETNELLMSLAEGNVAKWRQKQPSQPKQESQPATQQTAPQQQETPEQKWPTTADGKVDWKKANQLQRLAYTLFQLDYIVSREEDPIKGENAIASIEKFIENTKKSKSLSVDGYAKVAAKVAESRKAYEGPEAESFPDAGSAALSENDQVSLNYLSDNLSVEIDAGRVNELTQRWNEEQQAGTISTACYLRGLEVIDAAKKRIA